MLKFPVESVTADFPETETLTPSTPLPEVSTILPDTVKLLGSGFVDESLPHEAKKTIRQNDNDNMKPLI